ncbi:MAG TPA: hypothetical protein VGP72_10675 [Planctomycetota bacterium]|jgi:hypothetical protein
MYRFKLILALAVAFGVLGAWQLQAEDAPPAPGGQPPAGGQRRWDPEQFRQRMLDSIKEKLGASEEDWKALQPKVEAVQKLQREAMSGRFRGFGRGRGGPGGGAPGATPAAGDQAQKSEIEKKTDALQTLADTKDADPKAVKEKMQEVREAREKSKLELKKAQDALRELLTPRQEAQLMLMGMLD